MHALAGETVNGLFHASAVVAGSGAGMVLSGEADITNAADLADVISAQITPGVRYLTIDVAELSFADACTVRVLARAAGALRARGGEMVLLDPRKNVTRLLGLLGADQVLTIWRTLDGDGSACPDPATVERRHLRLC